MISKNSGFKLFIALFTSLILFNCSTSSEIDSPDEFEFTDCLEEAPVSDFDPKIEKLQFQLDSLVKEKKKYQRINGCMLVHYQGNIIYKNCNGLRSLSSKSKDSIYENTIFQLASLSKTFTAVAILQLAEQKYISLEDTLQKHFPEFPYPSIRIMDLLSHRSGIPNYIYAFEDSIRKASPPNNQTLIEWFIKAKPTRYAMPNRTFSYNNSNYAILAAIIEKVSGKSYAEYIRNHIALPIGMSNTYAGDLWKEDSTLHYTDGHEGKTKMKKDFWDDILGDKGVYSSVNDLYLWYKALNSECLLKKESIQLAFAPQSFEKKGFRNYGLGFRMWLKDDQLTPKYIYHNGWWKGYTTLFWMNPEDNCGVIILSNVKNKSIYDIKDIIELLEGQKVSVEEMDNGEE
ncbi:MAG: serine hydrolase domain-containing protein [Cytophagaceae bacterium]